MKLYLIRHGDAVSSFEDSQRPLSETGVLQVTRLAQELSRQGMAAAQLYHSGILRAEQTGGILQQILQIPVMEKLPFLQPESEVEPVLQNMMTWTDDTVLVSHLPYLPQLLWNLVGEASAQIVFQPATGVCLDNPNWGKSSAEHSASSQWQISEVLTG